MNQTQGYLLVFLSAIGFGTLGFFTKSAYANGLDVPSTLFWRFSLSAIVLVAMSIYRSEWRLAKKDAVISFLMGAVGYGGQAALFFVAIYRLDSGLAGLLLYLYPGFVSLLEMLVLRRKLGPARIVALIAGLAGCGLMCHPAGSNIDLIGVAAGIGAAAWYSVYLLVGEKLVKGLRPTTVSTYVCVGASLTFFLATVPRGLKLPVHEGWLAVWGLALLATVIPIATLFEGIRRVGAGRASILSTLEPVVTVLLGVKLLGEAVSAEQAIGMTLILLAVFLKGDRNDDGELERGALPARRAESPGTR